MYHFVCFVLLVSLEGIKTEMNRSSPINASAQNSWTSSSNLTTPVPTSMLDTIRNIKTTPAQSTTSKPADCLLSVTNTKEMLLFSIIALLLLICLLLLVIIMCMTCKCRRGVRNDKMVVMKSTKRTGVNGGPSDTDVAYQSVKVESETTTDEAREPVEVDGADAEVGNQVSTEEKKNSANENSENSETSETAPTQEVDQSGQTDLKMEDLEKGE